MDGIAEGIREDYYGRRATVSHTQREYDWENYRKALARAEHCRLSPAYTTLKTGISTSQDDVVQLALISVLAGMLMIGSVMVNRD
jgi:hypothetical protein